MNNLLKNRKFTAAVLGLLLLGGSQLCVSSQEMSAKKNDFVSQISQKRIDGYFQEIIRLSPRPPESETFQKFRLYLVNTLKSFSLKAWEESFTAGTPRGAIEMANVVAEKKGDTDRIIYLASHIDTKIIDGIEIQGANDSGSSTTALLELARVLSNHTTKFTYRFVFFDGEESIGKDMNDRDGLYGSKEHVRRLKSDNLVSNVHAMILLDMIGDEDPVINRDLNSSPELYSLFAACCDRLGYKNLSSGKATYMYDDHVPFLRAGIPSLDLIDFDYGPNNSFWHTEKDTAENVSTESIFKVAQVVACMLESFEEK
jgi:glutaminyl-peptide cyclotransferase